MPTLPARPPASHGSPNLLVVMTAATLAAMAIISTFLVVGSWALMVVALLGVAVGAVVVEAAIARSLSDEEGDEED